MKINFSNVNFRANKVSYAQAKYLKNTLKNSGNVNIICHTGTDADSATSAVVIASYLAQMGVKSKIIASKEPEKLGALNSDKYDFIKEKELNGDEKVEGTTFCVDFSSKDRVSSNAQKYIDNAQKLLCVDHHKGINISNHDYVYIDSPLEDNHTECVASCYIDSSAKSTTSVLYRFFEALGEDINNENAYNMFLGLADDAYKRGYLICDAKNGVITPTKDAYEDENFIEVYDALKTRLDETQLKQIIHEVDRTAYLTEDEKNLQDFLYENITFTPDNKIAYVAIEPDNELWKKAGGDTPTVSTIMNKFRQDTLLNKENDEKLKDLKVAMVFYKANGNYRVSLHSKDVDLHPIYQYIEENCPAKNISIGGHTTRGGGRIASVDKDSCNLWIKQVIEACEKNI